MSVVYRAADVPCASRAEYWRQVIAESIVPMEFRFGGDPGGEEIVTGAVGPVRVARSVNGPGEVRRTARHIRRFDPQAYQLYVQVDGRVVSRQDGPSVVLTAGDLSLGDLSRPFQCAYSARSAVLVTFPHTLLPLPRRDVERVLGTRISGNRGAGALVSLLARQLPGHLDEAGGAEGARVGSAILDLLTAAITARLDRPAGVPPGSRANAMRLRIEAFVEARLGDPDLDPASVAAAHHISLRYLHKLFQSRDRGVSGLIRHRRLERCRRDLLDPTLADRPVSAIGARWGFTSAAHFTRVFRDVYGLPPGEYRVLFGAGERPAEADGTLRRSSG